MIDATQVEYIPASPTFLISQLSDSAFVSSVCSPFLNNKDEYFKSGESISFPLSLAEEVLIPSAINSIKANNPDAIQKIPSLVKLIVDNHGIEGLSLIMDKVLPTMITSYRSCLSSASKSTMILIGDILCAISSKFRDDALIQVITKASCDSEPKMHVLAAYLIPLVRESSRVLSLFRSLSLDRVPQVRCEIVKGLPNCTFDESLTKYILTNSSKDQNITVRRAASMIWGKVAPELVDDFLPLLESRDTVKSALKSVKEIVIQNGLTVISNQFQRACIMEPELSAAVVLNIAKVVHDDEKSLLMHFAFLLKYTNNMSTHVFKFSQNFQEKEIFIDLLTPIVDGKQMLEQHWRIRKNLLEQALLFIPIFHEKLIKIAELYSKDPVAIIRDMSVKLWVALIKDEDINPDNSENQNNTNISDRKSMIINEAKQFLMDNEKWHLRLVMAKIVNEIGIYPDFEDVTEKLSHDITSNVRFCIAKNIINTENFDKFFGNCQDLDVIQLHQQKNL